MGLVVLRECVAVIAILACFKAQWSDNVQTTAEAKSVKLEKLFVSDFIFGVSSKCNQTEVYVEVQKTLLANFNPINVAAFTLGGCAAEVNNDSSSEVLIYKSKLGSCNSKLTVKEDELIYSFTFGMASGTFSNVPISIECHYPRSTRVPTSVPLLFPQAFPKADPEPFVFSLRLMIDDWISERISNQYYLGELLNVEASVLSFNQVPLRVFVDSCVATAVPGLDAVPRYSFIDNHGCLIDSKLVQSRSHFLPQTRASKLRFQMEAFGLQQQNSSLMYITCFLKAAVASAPADAEHKACSFSDGWTSAYGSHSVCSCCEGYCSSKEQSQSSKGHQSTMQVTLGPIMVRENVSK